MLGISTLNSGHEYRHTNSLLTNYLQKGEICAEYLELYHHHHPLTGMNLEFWRATPRKEARIPLD